VSIYLKIGGGREMKVGDLVKDTRHSPGYIPRPGIIVSIIDGLTNMCWVQFPNGLRLWVPMEAVELISESR